MPSLKWILILTIFSGFVAYTASADTPQNPVVYDDSIYVSHNGIHKFNGATLKHVWSSLQGLQTFEPVAGENLLFVGSPQGLYALDSITGRQVWRIEETHTLFSPTVAGQLYAGSLHGELYSIDPSNGKINWRKQFTGWIYSPVVLVDVNQLWTGGQAHQAFAISTKDGSQIHSIDIDQESIFSPLDLQNHQVGFNLFSGKTAIINTTTAKLDGWLNGITQPKNLSFDDRFFYRSARDGTLSVFDRTSFQLVWQKPVTAQDLTIHPTNGDQILMSDLDNSLVLFDPIKRTEVWRRQISSNWFAPLQTDANSIIYFESGNLQRNEVSSVKISAQPFK